VSRPRRIKGFPYTGFNRYFLTFCGRDRRCAFLTGSIVDLVLEQFRKTSTIEGFAILAYCFMPDHVHLLVDGTRELSDLQRFAKLAKQRSGAAHALSGSGRLWQDGYYERVLRDDDASRDVARYIVLNPVRAGLVASPLDYPYVGSDAWPIDYILDDAMW
jgi:putative transposase